MSIVHRARKRGQVAKHAIATNPATAAAGWSAITASIRSIGRLSRLCGDRGCRLEHVVRVTAKEVQQTRRCGCSARLVEPEPAREAGLKRRAEAVFGATDEEMQMTPHEPQEAGRLDKGRCR